MGRKLTLCYFFHENACKGESARVCINKSILNYENEYFNAIISKQVQNEQTTIVYSIGLYTGCFAFDTETLFYLTIFHICKLFELVENVKYHARYKSDKTFTLLKG